MLGRLLLAWVLFASWAPGAEAADGALGSLLAERALRGARIGVVVVDSDSGESLYAHGADVSLIPASNQKLLIAAAALEHWGPTHRFETPVFIDGALDPNGKLDGTLWIVGSGDPGLVSESLWKLAEEIRLAGVRSISGGIAIDTGYLDKQRYHDDWAPVSARAYHAPLGAFAVNYSSFRVEVRGARSPGQPASVLLAPRTRFLQVDSRVRTGPPGGPVKLGVDRVDNGGGDRVQVTGVVPSNGESRTYWRSVTRAEPYAASMLRTQLEAQGVRVTGATRIGTLPASGTELLRYRGENVSTLVQLLSKWSNNFVAEQLTKVLGAETAGPPGSWEKGTKALTAWLQEEGLPHRQVVVRDGSGLSPRNRLTAGLVVDLLRKVDQRFEWGPEFLAALPLGGKDGTLEDRLGGEPIPLRAKTGHLSRVAALSGFVQTRDGRRLAFSLLVNGARGSTAQVDDALDRFVHRLAALDRKSDLAAEGR